MSSEFTRERVDRLHLDLKQIGEALGILESQIRFLVRDEMIAEPEADPVRALDRRRFGYFSQHEEDGLLHALFEAIGTTNRWLVEIGCGDNGGNSGFLARECGWSGLMIDLDDRAVRSVRRLFGRSRVAIAQARVESGNVADLLARYGCPAEPDLLSVDVDGPDYWIVAAVTAVYRPRVIVAEYNSVFGPNEAVSVPDAGGFTRATKGSERHYFGASLQAFCRLAANRGYRLLMTEPTGVNALFVRNDVGPDLPGTTASQAFRYYLRHEVAALALGDVVGHFRAQGLELVDV